MRQITIASVLSLMVASQAWAIKDPETGVKFPDQASCGGEKIPAVGVGVREATFGIDVYAIVVYASAKAAGKSIRGTDECVKIRARFVRDVGAEKVMDAWLKSLKKFGVSPTSGPGKTFLSVVKGEAKKFKDFVMEVHKDKVIHTYMGKSVTIKGAAKLGKAIKNTYLSAGSVVPKLIADVTKRGKAKP